LKAEYLPGFVKDLKALRGSSAYTRIRRFAFNDIEGFESLEQIPALKRLRGFKSAYRARIGDYRVGFFFDGQTVIFARVLHRKDIYRFFP
jgi:mRNA-degrading endonuclease RelE of RelBE toxin-antitoxin system